MSSTLAFDFEEGDAGPSRAIAKTKKFSTLVLPEPAATKTPAKQQQQQKAQGEKKGAGEAGKEAQKPQKEEKKAAAPAAAPSTAAAPAAASTPEVQALEKAIDEQGKKVVQLKQDKAEKPAIDEAVAKLLELKNKLPEGHPLRPVARSAKKKEEKEKKKAAEGGETAAMATEEKKGSGENDHKAKKMERSEASTEEVERKKLAELKAVKTDRFGMLDMVQSKAEEKSSRHWTLIGDLGKPELLGKEVLIRGYAHAIKSPSAATFVLMRQRMHTVQCVIEGANAEMKAYVDKIPVESVLDVTGELVSAEVRSATMSTVEIKVKTLFIVQPARVRLPFQPREAERPPPAEGEEEEVAEGGKKKGTKNILQDMRLDHRTLDLRTPAMQAIARVSDSVVRYFAEYLRSVGFVEIMTPKLLAGASEGGAEVFKTDYFGQVACLAQSPQLHKQMCAACSGFERVFEIGPVFRAEKSLTARHMTEFHGLDLEMAIHEHYHEALEIFSSLFFYIFDKINETMRSELEVIRAFSPFEDLKYRIPGSDRALILEFSEGIRMLEEDRKQNNPGCITSEELALLKMYTKESDPSTPVEKRLGALVKQKYGVDFYMLDKYPLACRPFYTMPDPTNDQHPDQKKSNSYDFFIRGQEVLSGAQRVHDAKMLEDLVIAKGIPVDSLKFYIDAFKDGALPHAGGGIGLERVVMLFLGIPNIRWAALFSRDPKRLIP